MASCAFEFPPVTPPPPSPPFPFGLSLHYGSDGGQTFPNSGQSSPKEHGRFAEYSHTTYALP